MYPRWHNNIIIVAKNILLRSENVYIQTFQIRPATCVLGTFGFKNKYTYYESYF